MLLAAAKERTRDDNFDEARGSQMFLGTAYLLVVQFAGCLPQQKGAP